jgi:TetR/AcrR family transcriptional repressor of nem operon
MARTKEFDEEQVLNAAMHVFWELGYDGASLPDILAGTGLSRSSLYETFGDKRALFLKTFQLYTLQARERRESAFADPRGLLAGLSDYFKKRLAPDMNRDHPSGCFFTSVSATLKTADEELRDMVRLYADEYEARIREGFARSIETGEISSALSAREWAAGYLCFSWGLNVAQRMGRPRESLEAMVGSYLKLLAKK